MTTPKKNDKPSHLPDFPKLEEEVLKEWKEQKIFQQTLDKTKCGKRFVFFEGPPTANGTPHVGHVETRAFKDLILRYKTMRGFFVERKAGWDTQGLPVELEVEKSLGISGKKQIEEYGVEKFNAKAKESVWKYKDLWQKMSERIGFWLDYSDPYVTYDKNYIETLWWIFKQVWDKKLLVQDFKVVHYCPRCETALSSHEVAQGYQSVTEPSVYVKFELVDEPDTFILAWTTTPWTLPGNVALAVGKDIRYVKIKTPEGENLVLAEDRLSVLDSECSIVEKFTGDKLEGKKYKPLFDFLNLEKESGKKAYYIAAADFVSTTDGTGVVHTAVMYGEDDFQLGKKLDLPTIHTVDLTGRFTELVTPWKGLEVKDEKGETQKKVTEYLREYKLLFKGEEYTHDYPFCWRCHHPLLYYAKTSWFIRMSKLRNQLIANNQQINWYPENVKEGRFGEWLREVKDWAISRERYWGTPIPIWQCDNADCKHQECVGSYAELAQKVPSKNRYLFARHGHSTKNIDGTINIEQKNSGKYPLTEKGIQQITTLAQSLAGVKVDAIYTSAFYRAKQSAEILAKSAGSKVIEEHRLNEYRLGEQFEGMNSTEVMQKYFPHHTNQFHNKYPESETLYGLWERVHSLLAELENTYEGKTFILVTHGDPIMMALWACALQPESRLPEIEKPGYPQVGKFIDLHFPAAMFQPDGTFDPHRPFVDALTFPCSTCKGGTMRRIPEVADAWFDSGSMPFAQWHYPFENTERINTGSSFPADFITEAVDQTRGWFYTLLAVSTLLEHAGVVTGPPYRNVLMLGFLNDAEGKKLSKHLGNYIDPMELIQHHGADAVRFYLYSMNQPWESKNFDLAGVTETVRKNFLLLWNVVSFWELHRDAKDSGQLSEHVLDRYLYGRLTELRTTVSSALDRYDVTSSARAISAFIDELSTWYIRRSRSRFKQHGAERDAAYATLTNCLLVLSRILAPFTPFFAEMVHKRVGGEKASVHLEGWPGEQEQWNMEMSEHFTNELRAMESVKKIVEIGHALREQAKLRVRQPLGQLAVRGVELSPEMVGILKEELNVKEVIVVKDLPTYKEWIASDPSAPVAAALDTTITDELLHEGWVREVVRSGNDLRKQAGLKPGKKAVFTFHTDDETVSGVLEYFHDALLKDLGASEFSSADAAESAPRKEFALGKAKVALSILQ